MIFPYVDEKKSCSQGLLDFNLVQFRLENEDLINNIKNIDKNNKDGIFTKISELIYGYIKRGEDLDFCFI